MSILILIAVAHIRDPTKNKQIALSNTPFRPQMSLNFPQRGVEAAWVRRYADPIHTYPRDDSKSSEMAGNAGDTIVCRDDISRYFEPSGRKCKSIPRLVQLERKPNIKYYFRVI